MLRLPGIEILQLGRLKARFFPPFDKYRHVDYSSSFFLA
jgi:hypothetical protein